MIKIICLACNRKAKYCKQNVSVCDNYLLKTKDFVKIDKYYICKYHKDITVNDFMKEVNKELNNKEEGK